jgi:histone H3/H4
MRSQPGRSATVAIDRRVRALDRSGRHTRKRIENAVLEAVDQTVDRALTRFIRLGIIERIAGEAIAAGVPERVAEQLADAQVIDAVVERFIRLGIIERIAGEAIAAGVPERIAEQVAETHLVNAVLETSALQQIVDSTLESPAVERMLTQALESSLYDDMIDRVLASEELWRIVEEIARSPEVLSAVSAGSAGFANEMAGQVRRRTVAADDVAERLARRLLRRAPRSS